jgi:hypothetical protein
MATRTVRLDEEAEQALREIRQATGLPMSEALKRGLRVLRNQVRRRSSRSAFAIYAELDLGPGGYASAPSTEAKSTIRAILKQKHRR